MASKRDDAEVAIGAKDKTGQAFASAQSNLRNLASSAAVLEGPLGKVAGRMNALGSAIGRMNPLTIAAGVGISALLVSIKTATTEAGEYEQALFKVNAMLRATGEIAGVTSQEISDMSRELGDATLTNEKEALAASAALLRFTRVQNEFFEKTLKAGQDASAVFGGGLLSNVVRIGRALDNPRRGLDGLERNLISVTKAWKDNVIAMFEAGQTAEAQTLIFDKLRIVTGAGEGEAGGVVGKLDSLGEAWTRLRRNLELTGAVSAAAESVTNLFKALSDKIDPAPLAKYNRLLKDQEESIRLLNAAQGDFFDRGRDYYAQVILDRGALITQLDQQIQREAQAEAAKKSLSQVKQEIADKVRAQEKAETGLMKAFRDQEDIRVKVQAKRLKDNERLKRSAEAVWLASLPPIDKLKAEYSKDVAALRAAIEAKTGDVDKFKNALVTRKVRLETDITETTVKDVKKSDQIREQLLDEEAALAASFNRRALVLAKATAKLGDQEISERTKIQETVKLLVTRYEEDLTAIRVRKAEDFLLLAEGVRLTEEEQLESSYQRRALAVAEASMLTGENQIATQEQIQALSLRLAEEHEEAMTSLRVRKALEYVSAVTSVLGDLGTFLDNRSSRVTRSVNKEFKARADATRQNVKLSILTRKQGDDQLRSLEAQRQQQLDRTARVEFERGKKLRRAVAIIDTAAAITSVLASEPTLGAKLAAALAVGVKGAAQVASINATQYDGGGSVNTGGGIAPVASSVQPAPAATPQNTNVTLIGNAATTFTLDQVVGLIDSIRDVSGRLDLTVVDPSSRNASDIRNASNELVV